MSHIPVAPLTRCRICGAHSPLWTTTNRPFHKCIRCFCVQTVQVGRTADHERFYRANYGRGTTASEAEQASIWAEMLARTRGRIADLPGCSGRVLDFGCGGGSAVQLLRDRGIDAWGVDRFLDQRDATAHIRCGRADEYFTPESLSVIGAKEVLEHLSEPLVELESLSSLLEPGGIFAFTTVLFNPDWDASDFGGWWYAQDGTHVTFYAPESLAMIAHRCEWQIEWTDARLFLATKRPAR